MADTCRSCGAEIIWVETAHGKRMPLDKKPTNLRGLFYLAAGTAQKEIPTAIAVPKTYTSHFSTCPEADEWRKT